MAENVPRRTQRERARTGPAPVKLPPAPSHFSEEAAAMWRSIVEEWVLDAAALPILRGGLEAWDLAQEARRTVAAEGATFRTESGQIRQHPAAKIQLDALTTFRASFRSLGLEPAE